MEVRIVDARKGIVEALSGLGRLRFTWQGESPPEPGDHHVEIDIPDLLEWGREIWRAADGVPDPPPPKGQRLRGRLVGLDEHGVATIRAGGAFLLVETLGDPPLGTVDEEVELETLHLHAYPVHY